MSNYTLGLWADTGLSYSTSVGNGFTFSNAGNQTHTLVASDDDGILNDWSTGNYHGTTTAGISNGDTNSVVVSSDIPGLSNGEMVTSGRWFTLEYTDPDSGATETTEAFLLWDDTNNTPYPSGDATTYVFSTEPFLDGVTYTVTDISENAGVPWAVLTPPCLTKRTLVQTADGPCKVEDLLPGTRIQTKDNGLQPLRWMVRRPVVAQGRFAPIAFAPGAIGNTRRLLVSPQHRMLITGWQADLLFGRAEVLVAAKHLVNDCTIRPAPDNCVTYFHLMFDQHEIIYAEGAATESFLPTPTSLAMLQPEQRAEFLGLFPQFTPPNLCDDGMPAARHCLTRTEASVLSQLHEAHGPSASLGL